MWKTFAVRSPFARRCAAAFGFGVALMAPGCGESAADPSARPSVVVDFPPAASLSRSSQVRVRGKATSPSGVAGVMVAGTAATSADAFVNWEASVPLVDGMNDLDVDVIDGRGRLHRSLTAIQVDFADPLYLPGSVTVDSRADLAYVAADSIEGTIRAVRLSDGHQRLVSRGPHLLEGVPQLAQALAMDELRGRLLAVEEPAQAVVEIDVASGERRIFADASHGLGPPPGPAIAIDSSARVSIVIGGPDTLLSLDLESGDRTIVSDRSHGTGPDLGSPFLLALDAPRGVAYVASGGVSAPAVLFEVELATGDRRVIPNAHLGGGGLHYPLANALAADTARHRLLFLNAGGLYAHDLDTDQTDQVGGSNVGDGTDLSGGRGLAVHAGTDRVLVTHTYRDALLAFDLKTWTSTPVSRDDIGVGPPTGSLRSIAIDPGGGDVLLGSDGDPYVGLDVRLLGLDPSSGQRAIVSSKSDGTGPGPSFPMLAWDTTRGRALVLGSVPSALIGVDVSSGDRTIVSDDTHGTGPSLLSASSLAFDPSTGGAVVGLCEASSTSLALVDVASGDRAVVWSKAADWAGCPVDLGMDPRDGRAIVLTQAPPRILAVDLAAGTETVVADLSAPPLAPGVLFSAIAIDPVRRRGFVNLYGPEAWGARIIAVDLVQGGVAEFAEGTTASDMAFDPRTETLWVASGPASGGTVAVVDSHSGDAVIAAR